MKQSSDTGLFPMELHLWHRLVRGEPWPDGALKLPAHQVHRGFHLEGIQENTLAAFREARRQGAEMCECDVQLSCDCEPIVIHDPDLRRIAGHDALVRQLTTEQCRVLGNLPTLREMLADPEGPKFFNIELKTRSIRNNDLPKAVAKVVREAHAENRILFSSFNPFGLWEMQRFLPDVPRALLVTNVRSPDYSWILRKMLLAPLLKLHMLNLDKRMITADIVAFWRKQGMPISAWTVNDRAEIASLLDFGVRSVISDLAP